MNKSIFDEACSALKQSNCKTLVAFSNCPETHDVFVKAAKAGILDQLPFPTESVTYADCLYIMNNKAYSRKQFQANYRRHYQIVSNVDGLLDSVFGIDEEGGVDDNKFIPEFAMTVDQFIEQIEQETGERSHQASELLKKKMYGERRPYDYEFEPEMLKYSFKTKEEAIDYVMMAFGIFCNNSANPTVSLSQISEIPGTLRLLKMAIYLNVIDDVITLNNKKSTFEYKDVFNALPLCKNRAEYKSKFQRYYRFALNLGILDEYFGKNAFSDNARCKPGFWKEYENRYLAAKTCNNMTEYYQRFCKAAYITKNTPGEREKFYWFETPETFDSAQKINFVYVYLDEDVNNINHKPTAYVGRSLKYLKTTRDSHHKSEIQMDTVMKYFKNVLHKEVPEIIILKTDLDLEESQYWEDYYCHFYRNHGYYTINTGSTGIGVSSAGGVIKKWTYDICYQIALKCKNRNEMKHKYEGAYEAALRNKWLDDYYWFIPAFVWTYEMLIERAKKYRTYSKFIKNERNAYEAIKHRKWTQKFRDYFEHKK